MSESKPNANTSLVELFVAIAAGTKVGISAT
jgi:hypothetical protein